MVVMARALLLTAVTCLGACAAPITQMGSVTREQVAEEQRIQMRLALETALEQQSRLDRIALPLLRSAVPFCGDHARGHFGIRFGTLGMFPVQQRLAAQDLGFSDAVILTVVTPGSAADRAGLRPGDELLRVGDVHLPASRDPLRAAADAIRERVRDGSALPITFLRGLDEQSVTLAPDAACGYEILVERSSDLNAYADGARVVVTSAMMRFADDEELAVIVGHEIAHNAMRHIEAKQKNVAFGAFLGVLADVALAFGGYNSQGEFTRVGAEAGSMVFSQDFEREADYVGLYILARSGAPVTSSANVWRRLAAEAPGGIVFAKSHPTTAERFVRLGQWASEIEQKLASGLPLEPEVRGRAIALPQAAPADVAAAITKATPRDGPAASTPTTLAAASVPARTAPPRVEADRASAQRDTTYAHDRATEPPALPSPPAQDEPKIGGTTLTRTADGRQLATATIGAPLSEAARRAAMEAFRRGEIHFARHEWREAEVAFREALRLDGSVAAYHAALGAVLVVFERGAEAEAAYSAALLLDPENVEYQRGLQDARRVR